MQFRFLNAHPGRSQENLTLILWVVFFCYSICAALIFQKVVLPLMPSMHAGGGLMNEDAVYFDSVARLLAEQIRLHGWGSWQIYPANGARGNVAGLGALYALFGNHPTLIVPVNAAVVVRGMRYALVQLPFFVCGALLLKFAVANKHVVTVVAFAVVGLLVNVVASPPSILVTTTAYGLLLLGYMVSLKNNGASHFPAHPA